MELVLLAFFGNSSTIPFHSVGPLSSRALMLADFSPGKSRLGTPWSAPRKAAPLPPAPLKVIDRRNGKSMF